MWVFFLLQTPYNTSSEWTFLAEKREGCVYLDVRRTQSELDGSRNMHENQKRGAYAGRQFEIFSTHAKASEATSDHEKDARSSTSEERVVNENEEYCGLFSTTLSGKRLVVAAEIDCYDNGGDAAEDNYVELKTFRVLQREKDTFVFERFKLLAFWIQSFVVGIPKIVCGFRNDNFEICKLQTFKTTDIPSFCRKYWVRSCLPSAWVAWIINSGSSHYGSSPAVLSFFSFSLLYFSHVQSPNACLNFTSSFLDWLHAEAEEGRVYQVTYYPREHAIDMVDISASYEATGSSTASFLPDTAAVLRTHTSSRVR